MISPDEVFKIGTIGRPHGIKGEVCLHFTDDIFDTADADYLVCKIDGLLVPFFLEGWHFKGQDTAILKFEDLNTDNDVKFLHNAEVYFPKNLADRRDNRLTSWKMLTGFSVSDTRHGSLGTVSGVDETSANVLLDITTPGGVSLLLPIHPDLVEDFDATGRNLVLNLPDGLLDLNN